MTETGGRTDGARGAAPWWLASWSPFRRGATAVGRRASAVDGGGHPGGARVRRGGDECVADAGGAVAVGEPPGPARGRQEGGTPTMARSTLGGRRVRGRSRRVTRRTRGRDGRRRRSVSPCERRPADRVPASSAMPGDRDGGTDARRAPTSRPASRNGRGGEPACASPPVLPMRWGANRARLLPCAPSGGWSSSPRSSWPAPCGRRSSSPAAFLAGAAFLAAAFFAAAFLRARPSWPVPSSPGACR